MADQPPSPVSFFSSGSETDVSDPVTCKFVIIEHSGRRHLVMGPVDQFPYHALLVARFCESRQIAFGWKQRPDLVELYDKAASIRGGGMADLDPPNREARFYGASRAYGFFARTDVEPLVRGSELLGDYGVIFSDGG